MTDIHEIKKRAIDEIRMLRREFPHYLPPNVNYNNEYLTKRIGERYGPCAGSSSIDDIWKWAMNEETSAAPDLNLRIEDLNLHIEQLGEQIKELEEQLGQLKKERDAPKPNATFYVFKQSGKYYTQDRGQTITVDSFIKPGSTRIKILGANGGSMPGLSGPGDEFFVAVVPDEDLPQALMGVPVLINPKSGGE